MAERIVEQGAERFGSELGDLAQALKLIASGGAFLQLGGKNLQSGKIKLVSVVGWFRCDRGRKMAFLFGSVPLGAREPARDHVVGRCFAVVRPDSSQSRPRHIQLTE